MKFICGTRILRGDSHVVRVPSWATIRLALYAACPRHFSKPLVASGLEPDHIFWIVIDTMITGPAVRPYDTQKPWFS
jgi:hypothetical protein